MLRLADTKTELGPKGNGVFKSLIKKFPDVFATEHDPLIVTPFYFHPIKQTDQEVVYKKS